MIGLYPCPPPQVVTTPLDGAKILRILQRLSTVPTEDLFTADTAVLWKRRIADCGAQIADLDQANQAHVQTLDVHQ